MNTPVSLASLKVFAHGAFLAACLANGAIAQGLVPLDDDQLGDVSGQEGILISFEYYYNSDPATGAIDSAYCNASDLNCRFTWQIGGREDGENHSGLTGAAGEWLVYKDGYLSITTQRLSLDAAFLGDTASSAPAYESFYNPGRFKDANGNCLLEGVTDCDDAATAIATLRLSPGLRTHYPQTAGSYNPGSGESSGYNDARIGMQIGGLAVEYDGGGQPGYLRNENGSFMGLSIADNDGGMAGIAFGGDFYLYGF